jgi:hypothetical protein
MQQGLLLDRQGSTGCYRMDTSKTAVEQTCPETADATVDQTSPTTARRFQARQHSLLYRYVQEAAQTAVDTIKGSTGCSRREASEDSTACYRTDTSEAAQAAVEKTRPEAAEAAAQASVGHTCHCPKAAQFAVEETRPEAAQAAAQASVGHTCHCPKGQDRMLYCRTDSSRGKLLNFFSLLQLVLVSFSLTETPKLAVSI